MRKTWAGKLLAMVLTGVTVMGTMPAYAVFAEEAQQGTTYYVSSENGDDANDGTSEKKAFKSLDKINDITLQPGDKVLLEKGSVFDDQYIHVKGSGSAEAPIEISTYGEGDRPQINATVRVYGIRTTAIVWTIPGTNIRVTYLPQFYWKMWSTSKYVAWN